MQERLQKIISRAGIASRRHAEELILAGQVRVNGEVVTELGAKADPSSDRVEVAGRLAEIPTETNFYLLNKPIHVVATMSDPEGRATLRHVLRGLTGVFPVGRLDYAASGLLLLTNDGELAHRIFRISARMPKVFWIKVAGRLSDETMRDMRNRAHAKLRRLAAPDAVLGDGANPWYEAEMSDARRDLLRRELFAAGHPVEKIKRVKVGPLELGDLEEGRYRQMEPEEVERLRRAVEYFEKMGRPEKKGHIDKSTRFERKLRASKRLQAGKAMEPGNASQAGATPLPRNAASGKPSRPAFHSGKGPVKRPSKGPARGAKRGRRRDRGIYRGQR